MIRNEGEYRQAVAQLREEEERLKTYETKLRDEESLPPDVIERPLLHQFARSTFNLLKKSKAMNG